MKRIIGVVGLAAAITASPAGAQVGVAAHVGTMGFGADVAVALSPRVSLRGGLNVVPGTPEFTADEIEYQFDFPSPQFTLLADVFLSESFRLSGGFRLAPSELSVTGQLTGPEEIGDVIYTPSEVGTLSGTIVTQEVSPYLGIGFGNVALGGIGFFADLGVALHGSPAVTLSASEGSLANDADFVSDLNREAQRFEDDIDWYTFYPVLSVGISFGLN